MLDLLWFHNSNFLLHTLKIFGLLYFYSIKYGFFSPINVSNVTFIYVIVLLFSSSFWLWHVIFHYICSVSFFFQS